MVVVETEKAHLREIIRDGEDINKLAEHVSGQPDKRYPHPRQLRPANIIIIVRRSISDTINRYFPLSQPLISPMLGGFGGKSPAGGRTSLRVAVAGDKGTGKSSLISAVASETFPDNVPRVLPPITLPADAFPDYIPITIVDTPSRSSFLQIS